MKGIVFRDMTPSSPGEVHYRFGGMYCFRLHDRNVSKTSNLKEAAASAVRSSKT
jgi:hypothetical protein